MAIKNNLKKNKKTSGDYPKYLRRCKDNSNNLKSTNYEVYI
jgi:hypothetical protein